jgi:hypothetical protein
LTGQSPQRAVEPTGKEERVLQIYLLVMNYLCSQFYLFTYTGILNGLLMLSTLSCDVLVKAIYLYLITP